MCENPLTTFTTIEIFSKVNNECGGMSFSYFHAKLYDKLP